MKSALVRSLGLGCVLLPTSAIADIKPQDFVKPTKVTVGPYDNFESFISEDEAFLYYTQSQYMSSHIRRMDLGSGRSEPILDLDADSKNARVSPDGKHVAFTYFRHDAQGDICFSPVSKLDIKCVTELNVADHSPLWLDARTLAYVTEGDRGQGSRLLTYNIDSGKRQEILKGPIIAPSVSPDRSQLVYRNYDGQFILFDLATRRQLRQFRIALPGTTGMAHFGRDGRSLYFTQYILDSNRDLQVDGRDQGTIFRLDLNKQVSRILPEQLTSSEQNCSYPFPSRSALYVTCAFEGSLDVYRLPHQGLIPDAWDQADLIEAHLRARSYADRLLLVNHLHTSFKAFSELEMHERTLHNLILLGEWLAVHNYAKIIQEQGQGEMQLAYQSLILIAGAMARWETLPNQRITAEFSRFIDQQRQVVRAQLASSPALSSLVDAYFAFMLGRNQEARQALGNHAQNLPLLWAYLHTKLWVKLHPDPATQIKQFHALLRQRQLPEETRIYYLSALLEVAGQVSEPERELNSILQAFQDDRPVYLVIENEIGLYQFAKTKDQGELIKLMQEQTERSQKLREHYFAHRLLFNRAMILLSRFDLIDQQSSVVSLWLNQTKADTKEYPYVIEAFRQNTLDAAYSYLHTVDSQRFAKGSFFNNIRMSDDLESHYHYTRLNLSAEDWVTVVRQYDGMLRDALIPASSYEFIKMLRDLLTKGGQLSDKDLDQAIKVVESLPDRQAGAGVKYLLLGYLHQRKLDASRDGLSFDQKFAELAHRNYLLALDLSWNNDRIRAASFQNLGLLHRATRNYSLAAEYLTRRSKIPFEGRSQELAFRWQAAHSLYLANRFREAYQQSKLGLKLNPEQHYAWVERSAFYAMNAGLFEKAVAHYQHFFQEHYANSRVHAGVSLSYAYSLHQMEQDHEALNWYQKAIKTSESESLVEKAEGLAYHPSKTRFVAYGLMSQLDIPVADRISFLRARMAYYSRFKKKPSQYYFTANDLSAQELKDLQRLALIHLEANDPNAASQEFLAAMDLAAKEGKSISYVSMPIQQTFKNCLFHFLWTDPKNIPDDLIKHAQAIIKGMNDEAKEQRRPSPQFLQLWTEARLFMAALESHMESIDQRREGFATRAEIIFQDERLADLATTAPSLHASLQSYQQAMAHRL